ncbi:uracil-DNA glycosylase family protein [Flavobacterium sp. 7A]|uniref:uracil-DNA glycosylase family protein n=1 Tax=Flavobacterium sp. 7A TaxID=2940571 RepID=UPI002226540C|nr:uracil-DNA glycosylase family protein [Flavobacterium sp. 7A]MCW2118477.1 uracil-DNA glycosylase [Flavobacterium sp. 7A]
MEELLEQIRACTVCKKHLPLGANPIVAANYFSKIIIIGQAPGRIVHTTGIPWNDKSGDNLRNWLDVDKETFYNPTIFALIPMGFCYPGTGKSGDLLPRPECAPLWHEKLLQAMPNVKLILLLGKTAQNYYLHTNTKKNLTTTVQQFESYLPKYFPLPHPSPTNNIWHAKNKWFSITVLPQLKNKIAAIIKS